MTSWSAAAVRFYVSNIRRSKATFKNAQATEASIQDLYIHPQSYAPPKCLGTHVDINRVDINTWPLYCVSSKANGTNPLQQSGRRAIVYIHGGAFYREIDPNHWHFIVQLAHETKLDILVPIYPLIPRPTATAEQVIQGVIEICRDCRHEVVCVAGDSAGGAITLATVQQMQIDAPEIARKLRSVVLISPVLDYGHDRIPREPEPVHDSLYHMMWIEWKYSEVIASPLFFGRFDTSSEPQRSGSKRSGFDQIAGGKHTFKTDLWIVVWNHVYDVTDYQEDHPGGKEFLLENAGTDATTAYEDIGHSTDAREILENFRIGKVTDDDWVDHETKKLPEIKPQNIHVSYPAHIKAKSTSARPHKKKIINLGVLNAREYQEFPLKEKFNISHDTIRFVFSLPHKNSILGLPTGQHIAIRHEVDGKQIARSYTPTSSNKDAGRLELTIKIYEGGKLTPYLSNLSIGDKVEIRGPKGEMKYHKNLVKELGMIAGGTGITPMFQIIRRICEDPRDGTKTTLLYANKTEVDILLKEELDKFAEKYDQFKVQYVLSNPPETWHGGKGRVNKEMIEKFLPAPAGKISKPQDEIFTFQ
ncbi:hypothetical protein E8E12_002902 [Didymella heteroderae]|uniref:NADH-cytochrome b5 reductase 1 n=1 Tax=Didymella heteroderae TaxID=1769908 RepID=A0A9P4WK19_9PLEO|nr:hypothetical protein E8E12_002902 [Didymella heteroderae]